MDSPPPPDNRPIRQVMFGLMVELCHYLPAYTLDAVLDMSAAMQAAMHTTQEHKEALRKFTEKRRDRSS